MLSRNFQCNTIISVIYFCYISYMYYICEGTFNIWTTPERWDQEAHSSYSPRVKCSHFRERKKTGTHPISSNVPLRWKKWPFRSVGRNKLSERWGRYLLSRGRVGTKAPAALPVRDAPRVCGEGAKPGWRVLPPQRAFLGDKSETVAWWCPSGL